MLISNKIRNFILNTMQQDVHSKMDVVNLLLKLVKAREDLFFELLSFVHKNIESSSNDIDNTTIFHQFLPPLKLAHHHLLDQQQQLLESLGESMEGSCLFQSASKEMLRLSSRVIELLQASLARVRRGIFDEGGRSGRILLRFKVMLHKILRKEPFIVKDYAECVINYTTSKFKRQLAKIQKYLQKLSQGENIFLKDLYAKASDIEASSPQQKLESKERKTSPSKKPQLKLEIEGHEKLKQQKKSLKRPLRTSIKKRQKLQSTRHKPKDEQSSEEQPQSKQQTANKLLKFYQLLDINRKQFLEDYVFKEAEAQKRKSELLNKLLERNKVINTQITQYVKKNNSNHLTVPHIIMPIPNNKSSGEQQNQSFQSKPSHRHSFHVSKRKSSFQIQSSSGAEKQSDQEIQFDRLYPKKPSHQFRNSSHSNHRQQKPQIKSRKLFIVKEPLIFQDDMIPQAHINETQRVHIPHIKRGKKNENIRLKRKNNPSPLENANFPQNFRYPF